MNGPKHAEHCVRGRRRGLLPGAIALGLFVALLAAILFVDVEPIGPEGTCVGLAAINGRARDLIGVNYVLYEVSDWMGLVPIASMLVFALVGLAQLVRRRSLARVDRSLLLLGASYAALFALYLLFDRLAINYRPVILEGALEPSFPSSHCLLAVGAMGVALVWARDNLEGRARSAISILCVLVAVAIVVCRLLAGVYWVTDIAGGILLGLAVAFAYRWLGRCRACRAE